MFKLFTLESAHRLLPTVDRRLGDLQDAIHEFETLRAQGDDVRPGTPEAYALAQERTFVGRQVQDARNEVRQLGVLVPDVSEGTVEFPSRVDGEIVHLVWHRGEAAIRSYHRLAGDERLRPLVVREGPPAPQGPPSDAPSSESPIAPGASSGTSSNTSAGSN